MYTKFDEDILLSSWVIAILVKVAPPLTKVLASLYDRELKVQGLQWFGSDWDEKPMTSLQKNALNITQKFESTTNSLGAMAKNVWNLVF